MGSARGGSERSGVLETGCLPKGTGNVGAFDTLASLISFVPGYSTGWSRRTPHPPKRVAGAVVGVHQWPYLDSIALPGY